jgi:hypothetical protein
MMATTQGGAHTLALNLAFPGVGNAHLGNGWGDNPGTWNLYGNVSSPTVALGQWHRVEMYAKGSTTSTSRDGILRWWLDGNPVGSYTNVNTSDPNWNMIQFTPSWDKPDPTQRTTDYFWYDHVRISSPQGSGAQDQPPGPPSAPQILSVTVK